MPVDEMLIFKSGNIASIVVQKVFKTDFDVIHESDADYASKKYRSSYPCILTDSCAARHQRMARLDRDSRCCLWLSSLHQPCSALGKKKHYVGLHGCLYRRNSWSNVFQWQLVGLVCRPLCFRYRDWYHDSFAFDLPYRGELPLPEDQFVQLQLQGTE
jgi:hypothetical protein